MKTGTHLTISNAIHDYINPLIKGFERIEDQYAVAELKKARDQINKAIKEEGITE